MYHLSMVPFWDRQEELAKVRRQLGKGVFGYVTGRRRVGKTALLQAAVRRFGGLYHQAVEGTPQQQLLHVTEEFREALPIFRDFTPKGWEEFFRLLSRQQLPKLFVIDEFPYWVQADPALPSHLQKWIDHDLPKQRTLMLVSGSSQSMLYSQFLRQGSPLYGRALLHIDLAPLNYRWFCRALGLNREDPTSFVRFSLVGGVPHYWRLIPQGSVVHQTEALYFEPTAILSEEPIHLLRDEGIVGSLPKAILDLVGRGVAKPSELASRLGTPQSNLSRPLALLVYLGLLHRELPFGESSRTTKKVLYSIQDPALCFYYGTALAFRGRWPHMTGREKLSILNSHATRFWEQFCRQAHPGASQYWEGDVEIDLVAPVSRKRFLVAECKWARLSARKERAILDDLKARFAFTRLSRKLSSVSFQVLTPRHLTEF